MEHFKKSYILQGMIEGIKKNFGIVCFLTGYFIVTASVLITRPLPFYDWDESIYAEVGREMITHHSYFVPLWQGKVWLDKPPLVPLLYGTLMKITSWIEPEISTRIFTLAMATICLAFVYFLYKKVTKESLIPLLATILTAVTPLFYQRAVVLNIDVFLLIGWLGYILFFRHRIARVFFLFVAVMSKSLIGFYAPAIMLMYALYEYYSRRTHSKQFWRTLIEICSDCALMSVWYIGMCIKYRQDFWIQHVYESHFRRVTASIESHFGQRTYYIDLLYEMFGRYAWISIAGGATLLYQWRKKHINDLQLLYALALFPWFAFLNLTKTKIFWYSHPYIPQFAFLIVYPLVITKSMHKYLYKATLMGLIAFFCVNSFVLNKIQLSSYSSFDAPYKMSLFAKEKCTNLSILMPKGERDKIETLNSLGLTIRTTTWWGDHPAMVYYYGKRIEFIYNINDITHIFQQRAVGSCIILHENDASVISKRSKYGFVKKSDDLLMYITYPQTEGYDVLQ